MTGMRPPGPVGRRVAANVATARRERRLSLADLASLLASVGVPIHPDSLSRVELGGRLVNVDELVALAECLSVTPAKLLGPTFLEDT